MKISMPTNLITSAFVCFALVHNAPAVSPPPDGGYANRTTAEGQNALFNLTSGSDNTAIGFASLWHNTSGSYNTAIGEQTLYLSATGIYNTATGYRALYSNTGSKNTAGGFRALYSNTTGDENTATGFQALFSNTTGFHNAAVGIDALLSNTIGAENTANGSQALYHNTTGSSNTAVGSTALFNNTSGESNTATGFRALSTNGMGSGNTANGANTLSGQNGNVIPDWSNNTAVGANALVGQVGDLENNTAIGAGALPLIFGGQNNIAIGYRAGSNLISGDNNIYIGNLGVDTEFGSVYIGTAGTQTQTFIAGISGTAVTGTPVVVDGNGQLGVAASSARFKDEIEPMNKASEAILALKPVTFRYKPQIDPTKAAQFGLVAEDVAKVNSDLVARDREGKPFTVRYEAVNAMLLNEFLKAHSKIDQQEAAITQLKSLVAKQEAIAAEQQKEIGLLTAGLKEQAQQVQKVISRIETTNPRSQVALTDHN